MRRCRPRPRLDRHAAVPNARPPGALVNGGAAASPPQALLAALQSLLKALSVAMLASYFVLILMQVFFRFVINESLFWAEELVRGLLVWGVMIGSVLVARARGAATQ